VLGERLSRGRSGTEHLAAAKGPARYGSMEPDGLEIDALKLVSCMTLPARAKKRCSPVIPQTEGMAPKAEHAETFLPPLLLTDTGRCTYTRKHLRRLST